MSDIHTYVQLSLVFLGVLFVDDAYSSKMTFTDMRYPLDLFGVLLMSHCHAWSWISVNSLSMPQEKRIMCPFNKPLGWRAWTLLYTWITNWNRESCNIINQETCLCLYHFIELLWEWWVLAFFYYNIYHLFPFIRTSSVRSICTCTYISINDISFA
jgi:hypothetical protein